MLTRGIYLLDTDTCIALLKKKPSVIQHLRDVGVHNCKISDVTIAELYFGAVKSGSEKHFNEVNQIPSLFESYSILYLLKYAEIRWELEKVYRTYDLKTVFGKASVGDSLLDSVGQCNNIIINMTTEYNTRRLAYAIKRYFEVNEKAWEVLIFKGRKRIPIKRTLVVKPEFFAFFKKAYER